VTGALATTETGQDTLVSSAEHVFFASADLVETGSDTFAGSIIAPAHCYLYAKESGADHFSSVSTHADFAYMHLVEGSDTFSSSAKLAEHCYLAAVEQGSDRFFCYTSGIFPLHAARSTRFPSNII
jgi:hypothetical protein